MEEKESGCGRETPSAKDMDKLPSGLVQRQKTRKPPKRQRPGSDSTMEASGGAMELNPSQLIRDIQSTIQASLKDSIHGIIQEVIREVTHNLESKIEEKVLKRLSDDIFIDLGHRISQAEHSMHELTKQVDTLKAYKENVGQVSNQDIQDELNSLKESVSRLKEQETSLPKDNKESIIVIKGMTIEPDTDLAQSVTELAQTLDLPVNIQKVNIIPGPSGVIIATLDSKQERDQLLQKKYNLRNTDRYKMVYIEADRPKEERKMEANIRKLVRQFPNLQMRKGMVISSNT